MEWCIGLSGSRGKDGEPGLDGIIGFPGPRGEKGSYSLSFNHRQLIVCLMSMQDCLESTARMEGQVDSTIGSKIFYIKIIKGKPGRVGIDGYDIIFFKLVHRNA